MSFRDLDENFKREPRKRGRAERWLRVIFLEDWGLKVLALIISLALWYGVTGQRTPTTIRMRDVRLSFRLPVEMEISNEPRSEVEVTLTGNKYALERINARDLIAYVDVSDFKPGEYNVQLTTQRVAMGLPDGVRIDNIEPGSVALRIEPRAEREVQVEVRHTGSVPEGYELRAMTAAPDKVKVRGPLSRVNGLQKAPTEVISLEGHTESFALPQAAIEIPDRKIDVLDAVVEVKVEIGEQRVEKNIGGVPVTSADGVQVRPERASVTLFGERSALNQLNADNVRLVLDVGPDGNFTPRLELPADLQGRVELRSTNPSIFTRRSFF